MTPPRHIPPKKNQPPFQPTLRKKEPLPTTLKENQPPATKIQVFLSYRFLHIKPSMNL